MVVMMARDTWTDERLDDLNQRVDRGFTEMREEFRAVRGEMHDEFSAVRSEMRDELGSVRAEIRGLRGELGGLRGELGGLRGELGEVRAEMAAARRTFVQAAAAIWVTSMVGFLGVIATIVSTA